MTIPLQHAKSATDAAGDLFLSGSYIELGVSPWGNFGTTQGQTPVGYAQAGSRGVGLTYNQAGFGVNADIPTIDYFTPGTPYEFTRRRIHHWCNELVRKQLQGRQRPGHHHNVPDKRVFRFETGGRVDWRPQQ